MKFYTVYTPELIDHLRLLERSMYDFGKEFTLHPIVSPLPTGFIRTIQHQNNIDFKLDQIVKTVASNLGETIVWADVDIVFVGYGVYDTIQSYIADADTDMCCVIDEANIDELNGGSRANGGFFVIKCTEKTLLFWRKVRDFPKKRTTPSKKEHSESNHGFYEQDVINTLLPELNVKFLPESFWCCHRRNEWGNKGVFARTGRYWPEKIILFHATSYIDSAGKLYKIQRALMGDFGPNPIWCILDEEGNPIAPCDPLAT